MKTGRESERVDLTMVNIKAKPLTALPSELD